VQEERKRTQKKEILSLESLDLVDTSEDEIISILAIGKKEEEENKTTMGFEVNGKKFKTTIPVKLSINGKILSATALIDTGSDFNKLSCKFTTKENEGKTTLAKQYLKDSTFSMNELVGETSVIFGDYATELTGYVTSRTDYD
jgi:hypothetical protein